ARGYRRLASIINCDVFTEEIACSKTAPEYGWRSALLSRSPSALVYGTLCLEVFVTISNPPCTPRASILLPTQTITMTVSVTQLIVLYAKLLTPRTLSLIAILPHTISIFQYRDRVFTR